MTTTKTISSTINGGYSLSNAYSALSITTAGAVNGYFPGGLALSVSFAAETDNAGLIAGAGAGPHSGGIPTGNPGGGGASLAGGTFSNSGRTRGGYGNGGLHIPISGAGYNGASGGAGGAAIDMTAAGVVLNSGTIAGGAGGAGGSAAAGSNGYNIYYTATSGTGGAGGAGVVLGAGGSVNNIGLITGGAGGAAGEAIGAYAYAGYAGSQGWGVSMQAGGAITNGSSVVASALISGGVYAKGAAATVTNSGAIEGDGSNYGFYFGVELTAGGRVTNGASGAASALITDGVYFGPGGPGTLVNYGTVTAGSFFNASGDRLVAEPGSYFGGVFVNAGLGVRATLELVAGSETATDLGSNATITGGMTVFASQFATYLVDAADSLTLSGLNRIGFSLIGKGTIALDPGATLNVYNGGVAEITGSVVNAGVIGLMSTGAKTDLSILSAGATLGGGGTVSLNGAKARILGVSGAPSLTNIDNAITGVGSLGAKQLTLINEAGGVIEATGLLTIRDAAGHSLTNSGLIEAGAAGKLALVSETINQAGGGTILAAGGVVALQDVDLVGGTLATTGAGRVNVEGGGATLDGRSSHVGNLGLLQVTSAQTLTVKGNLTNSGKLDLHAARLVIGGSGAMLSGAGQLNLNASASNVVIGTTAANVLTNVDNRIAGSGQFGDGVMTLINDIGGSIIGNQTVALTINTGTISITNAGLIENVGKGGVVVDSVVDNTGTLRAAITGTLTLAANVTGTGVAQIAGGTLFAKAAFSENVTFTSTTGTLELARSQAYTGKVKGLSSAGTNALDLVDIAFTSGVTKASYSGTTASGTLTVTDGTHTARISLLGDYVGSTFTVSSDGHGGTKVVDPGVSSPALAQALASFQHGPAPSLAGTAPDHLPRMPVIHVRA